MISIQSIAVAVKERQILTDINVEVAAGDCIALIGPNGAGKTTLLSCLLGDRIPSQGRVLIDGQAPKAKSNKSRVAVLPQENVIPHSLTVAELMAFFRRIYPQPLTLDEVRELLGFSPEQERQLAERLSGGQQRLLAFVLCLIGRPKLLILDEPTAGMDTSTRQRFWGIVQALKAKGVTIVYSSHYIEEVEHTADRLLVLHQGRLLRDTTPFAMRQEEQEKQVTLPLSWLDLVQKHLPDQELTIKSDTVTFMTKDITAVWEQLQAVGCRISDIEIQNKTLLNALFDQTKTVGADEPAEQTR